MATKILKLKEKIQEKILNHFFKATDILKYSHEDFYFFPSFLELSKMRFFRMIVTITCLISITQIRAIPLITPPFLF